MRVTRQRRQGPAGRRLDVTALREITKDDRMPGGIAVGIVKSFEIDAGEDVLVEVELQPSRRTMTCRLVSIGGGSDSGAMAIPVAGSEVLVAIKDGEPAAGGYIIGTPMNGSVPSELDDEVWLVKQKKVTIIVTNGDATVRVPSGRNVLIDDGGGAQPVATKADVDAVKLVFDNHVHILTVAGAAGSGATGTAAPPAVPFPPPAGTQVLKAR